MLGSNLHAKRRKLMQGQGNAPPQQPQQSPAFGLFSQAFEKPKMTLGDKLGMLGGRLMDMDGTLGSGNYAMAKDAYDTRVSEARDEFGQNQQRQLMMMAAQGDPMALFMLDPALAMSSRPKPAEGFTLGQGQQRFDAQGNMIASVDPKEADPRLPTGMWRNPETGQIEPVPGYVDMQTRIAAARGSNANNVQSTFTGEDGTQYIVRRDGTLEPLNVKARNPFQITDVGGVPTAIDRLTGQGTAVTTPETVGSNKATIATITANEEARQQAQQDLPKAVATIDRGIATLEALKQSPGFDKRYGLMSVIPVIPGTDMADTQALIDQVGGQAFLTAFESLKGGGQITEIEGQKATQAITTLTTQSIRPETAAKAIEDLIEVQRRAKERMSAQASGVYAAPGENQNTITFDPATGRFSDE